MKKVIFTLAGLPALTVVIMIVLVAGIFSPDAAHQACVYGEGTLEGQKVYTTSSSSSWVSWALKIAADDSHGYSQTNRDGNPDYDCSSLVYYALKHAGLDVGSSAFSTREEGAALEKAGFERHDWTNASDLRAGDIVWKYTHTEIYVGDGKFVGAHQDENGGIEGKQHGDQTGQEISVDTDGSGYTAYYRYKGSGTSSVATKNDGWNGLTSTAAKAQWFGGLAGPGNTCATYPEGQCTWGACVRAYHIGWRHVGQYWGNGQNWAASARAEGFRTTTSLPVPGAIVSFPGGVQGSSPGYGHVAVVENVDTSRNTILISEMNVQGSVYSSRTMPILNGGVYILPNDAISGTSSGGSSGNLIEVKETKKANGRYEVNVAAEDRPSQCSASDSPFDYAPPVDASDTSSGTIPGGAADPNGIHASAENAKKYARAHLKDHGWNDLEFIPLENLWTRESGWQWNATNPSSGAYGIPQSLPATKMSSAGSDWHDNAYTQINWGFSYIAQRYGSPSAAWNHSQQTGWY